MKRLTAGILTAALILALAGTTALASGRCHGRQELCYPSCAICSGTALHCQDADGDGVCDNLGNGYGFVDEDGDGICDHQGIGRGFVDEDGDGICDHQGTGRGFIDEDGDGICDNQGTGCRNQGAGKGWQRGNNVR